MAQAPQYAFPVMDEREMIQSLQEINYPFRQEWKKPTPAIAMEICQTLVDIVVDVTADRLSRPEAYTMEKHNIHPDVYSRGFADLGMLMMIFEVMEACCIFNFSMKDLQQPTWSRLRVILSGVLNFVHFQRKFFSVFHQQNSHTNELRAALDELNAQICDLATKYNEYVGSPEVRLLKQLQREHEELEHIYLQKKQQRQQAEDDCRQCVAQLKLMNEKVLSCDETLKLLKYELSVLKQRDITGLVHDVELLKAKVEVSEQNNAAQQQDLVVLRAKHDLNVLYGKLLNNLHLEFEGFDKMSRLHHEAYQRIITLEQQLSGVKVSSEELKQQKEDLELECQRLQHALTNTNNQYTTQIRDKQQEVDRLICAKQDWEAKELTDAQQVEDAEREIAEVEEKSQQATAQHIVMINAAIQRLTKLQDAVDKYQQRVMQAQRGENENNNNNNNNISSSIQQQQQTNNNYNTTNHLISPQLHTGQTPDLSQYTGYNNKRNNNNQQQQQNNQQQPQHITPTVGGGANRYY